MPFERFAYGQRAVPWHIGGASRLCGGLEPERASLVDGLKLADSRLPMLTSG